MAPCSLPSGADSGIGNQPLLCQSDNLNNLTSKINPRTSLNLNSLSGFNQSNESKMFLCEEVGAPPPPPPPGFVDDTNQYYLPENEDDDDEREEPPPPQIVQRRNRPQMTLTFGTNTSKKTLMFATNSPFALNSCVDINPNLPLDRQE